MQRTRYILLVGAVLSIAGAGLLAHALLVRHLADAYEATCRAQHAGPDAARCMNFADPGGTVELVFAVVLLAAGGATALAAALRRRSEAEKTPAAFVWRA